MELVLRNSDQKFLTKNLNQHVLVIPSVSNGNVGQLAVECLVHNFDVATHLDVRIFQSAIHTHISSTNQKFILYLCMHILTFYF